MPHVHEPAPGVTIALGYNGRGIALATSMGRHLAAFIAGTTRGLPFPPTSIEPIPLHALQRFYILQSCLARQQRQHCPFGIAMSPTWTS